jgi:hypothetical protein
MGAASRMLSREREPVLRRLGSDFSLDMALCRIALTLRCRCCPVVKPRRVPSVKRAGGMQQTRETPYADCAMGLRSTGREHPDLIFETGFVFPQNRPDILAQKRPPSSWSDRYLDKNL